MGLNGNATEINSYKQKKYCYIKIILVKKMILQILNFINKYYNFSYFLVNLNNYKLIKKLSINSKF